ncbi:hypothetical protein KFE96_07270 [Kordiimonas sp. SCSIO 12603]|uniref:hypothetical protein n=1 Tax=Kordiimonas sp. SCSIO 12603 TaxID=2829596 RepID=UPI002104DA84|nr:hypothetical protein [Kordiimonas sp. SCSIO 12603]UTW60102.1 hypothetical protein KFE96_07270 [Kordiimonas sp. SCSIO 12603]
MSIVGALLSSMFFVHFNDDFGLARARWWWEIMMNLQALSCAFVWFCYVDRLRDLDGNPRPVMKVRMWAALLLTLTPAWVTLYAAYRNWFVERPEMHDLNPIFVLVIVSWIVSILIPRAMYLAGDKTEPFSVWKLIKPTRTFWRFLAVIIVVLVGALQLFSLKIAYMISPFLLFFITSIGYFQAGIGIEAAENKNNGL